MLLRYCLSDFEMFTVAPIITSITFAFTLHMNWISIMRPVYFKIFSASLLITFLSPGIATSINVHVSFLLTDYDAWFIIIIIIITTTTTTTTTSTISIVA